MSASIQRVVATPLHAVAESNIALAHLNFDFSLAKFEAPAELHPLGKRLSKSRRESAEDGSFHILARRLGVLFDNVLPDVPALLEAYGTRASEIVQRASQKLDKPSDIVDGFFGSHLGIDSTTIWASATSGKSVLRIHLLACILARIWSPQEATAIWVELVSQRQQAIKKEAQSAEIADNYLAQLAAAHEIERSSLGNWDASARAWLEVADQAERKRQVQTRLILNNLSVAVKSQTASNHTFAPKNNSYDSVLFNLNHALTTLDKLIKGEPQRITDGGILLGLISWHIYPDLVVLGPDTKEIRQQDTLVKAGGIVTISISSEPSSGDGVYWSLPLASLQYYGTVQRERSTMRDSRISMAQLQALSLGASLGADDATFTATEILQSLWKLYYGLYQSRIGQGGQKCPTDLELLENLASANVLDLVQTPYSTCKQLMKLLHLIFPFKAGIELLLSADSSEKGTANQLMRYGSNYGRTWIGNTRNSISTLFGLAKLPYLLNMITSLDARIQLLRDLCAQYHLQPSDYMIRFRTSNNSWGFASITGESVEIAHRGLKRKRHEYESQCLDGIECLEVPPGETWLCLPPLEASIGMSHHFFLPSPSELSRGEASAVAEASQYDDIFAELVEDGPGLPSQDVYFDFAFGNHSLGAVYSKRKLFSQKRTFSSAVPFSLVQKLLDMNMLNPDTVAEIILHYFEVDEPVHGKSLLALGRVADYYQRCLPQATVSMGVLKNPIHSLKWSQRVVNELDLLGPLARQQALTGKIPTIYPNLLSRTLAFAAILQFESGSIDVDISDLNTALAISSGNSLFIAEEVLHDPVHTMAVPSCAISHMIGNVGKPGVALLIPPPEVDIRKHDLEQWHFVNHNPFDGRLAGGKFEGTSIHLSFTGWEGPIGRGSSSYRDMEAYYLETKVSANDGGDWVGDLDILKGISNLKVRNGCLAYETCSHDPSLEAMSLKNVKTISIDCWEELLDPPDGFLVLRSTPDTRSEYGSWRWMVRLTAVSIAASRNYDCICLPVDRDFCWTCTIWGLPAEHRKKVLLVC